MTENLELFEPKTMIAEDMRRFKKAQDRIYCAMTDNGYLWWTLNELAKVGQCSPQGASARLRDFRKPDFKKYGVKAVHRRRKKNAPPGTWEYKLELK